MPPNLDLYALAKDEGQALWFLNCLTFVKATSAQTGGAFGLIEQEIPAGFASPYHRHHAEDEAFYLLSGAVTFISGEQAIQATAGSYVFLPKEQPHGFRVDAPTRMLILVTPAGFEQFVTEEVQPILEEGYRPADLYGGFRMCLRELGRRGDLQEMENEEAADTSTDGFPALGARLAYLAGIGLQVHPLPAGEDRQPARALLADARAVEARCAELRIPPRDNDGDQKGTLRWDEVAERVWAPRFARAVTAVKGALLFELTGAGGFRLLAHLGGEPPAEDAPPATAIRVDAEAYRELRSGALQPQDAFLAGKIQVEGDMQLAMQLALAVLSPD